MHKVLDRIPARSAKQGASSGKVADSPSITQPLLRRPFRWRIPFLAGTALEFNSALVTCQLITTCGMIFHILSIILGPPKLVPTFRASIQVVIPDRSSQSNTRFANERDSLTPVILKLRCAPIARRTWLLTSSTSVFAHVNPELPHESVVAFLAWITLSL